MAEVVVTSPSGKRYRVSRGDAATAPFEPSQPGFLQRIGKLPISPLMQVRDVPGVVSQGLNEAAFGIPGAAYRGMTGRDLPHAESPQGKISEAGARVAGFMFGGPLKLAGRGAKKVATAGLERFAPQVAKKFLGRTAVSAAEGAASLGSTALTEPSEIPGRAAFGAAGGVAGEGIGTGYQAGKRFLFPKQTGLIPSEAIVNRMPASRRAEFFEKQTTRAKASEARQVKPLAEQQELGLVEAEARGAQAKQRLAAEQTTRTAQLDQQKAQIDRQLFETAKGRTVQAREPFMKWLRGESDTYRQTVREGLEASKDVQVTARELYDGLSQRFADQPGVASSFLSRVGVDVSQGVIPDVTFTAKQVLNSLDEIGAGIKRGVSPVTRVYGQRDVLADDARGVLLDILENKGVTEAGVAKARWRDVVVPTRDRGVRILHPFDPPRLPSEIGARVLIQAAKGKGNIEVVQDLEQAVGQSLTSDLKQMVNQLDDVKQQRLLSEVHAQTKGQQIASTQSRVAEDVKRQFLAKSEPIKQRTAERVGGLEKQKFLSAQRAERGQRIRNFATTVGAAGFGLEGLRRVIRAILNQ